jgi:hypothetical protein
MVTLTKEPQVQVHEPEPSSLACEKGEDNGPITVDELIHELICVVHHS